jgi:hypothetical protein
MLARDIPSPVEHKSRQILAIVCSPLYFAFVRNTLIQDVIPVHTPDNTQHPRE